MSWQAQGECLGAEPNIFFPERGQSTEPAKAICALCVVREECLEYALDNNIQQGVFGGMSGRERRQIRRLRGN